MRREACFILFTDVRIIFVNVSTVLSMSEIDFNDIERLIFVSNVCLNEDQFVVPGVREGYFFIEIELEFGVIITEE